MDEKLIYIYISYKYILPSAEIIKLLNFNTQAQHYYSQICEERKLKGP